MAGTVSLDKSYTSFQSMLGLASPKIAANTGVYRDYIADIELDGDIPTSSTRYKAVRGTAP